MNEWPSELPDPAERGGYEPREGYRFVWEVDTGWRLPAPGRTCGYHGGGGASTSTCGAPAVALMRRKRFRLGNGEYDAWHAYCADHLYGRRVVDGKVWRIVTRPIAAASADGSGPR